MTLVSPAHRTPILIGEEVFSHLSLFLKERDFSSIFVLVDENTLQHCLPELITRVPKLLEAEIVELESGEENKNLEVCAQVWSALTELDADRDSLLINLGGGVISDLGGFVASTFKRGIRFINVPTTLLAQVDASVGGKTGIDLGPLKNQIGVFSDPEQTLIYPPFLRTLPEREYTSGLAEILKHGLIADAEYWNLCCECDLNDFDFIGAIIKDSIAIKTTITDRDPKEQKERKWLNFGHTVGHAVEGLFLKGNEKTLLHGEAVAVGMICEAWISHQQSGLSVSELSDITRNICAYFPLQVLNPMDDHRILELMRHDKKNRNGEVRMALLKSIGSCVDGQLVSAENIISSINYYRSLS